MQCIMCQGRTSGDPRNIPHWLSTPQKRLSKFKALLIASEVSYFPTYKCKINVKKRKVIIVIMVIIKIVIVILNSKSKGCDP